jgi:Uma2 family endonuclease
MNAPLQPDLFPAPVPSPRGEPVWELAREFPLQGEWTEEQYLALQTKRLVELSDGCLEFLPMPLPYHQFIVRMLFGLLNEYVNARKLGEVLFAPLPVRLQPGEIREPDVAFFRPGRIHDIRRPPDCADLVMEVVSPGSESHERDYDTKRSLYAAAGIPEYWIVDPEKNEVTVLALDSTTYRVHGVFRSSDEATSAMFPDFRVPVGPLFAVGQGQL